MVHLPEERIEKYRKIFKEEYGRELTKQEAFEAAHNLVGFFDLLLKIDMRNKEKIKTLKSKKDE